MNPEIRKVFKAILPVVIAVASIKGVIRWDNETHRVPSAPSTPSARSWTPLSDARVGSVSGVGMTPDQINVLPNDPAVDQSYYIGTCLQPDSSNSRVFEAKQPLLQKIISRVTSLVSPSSVEAAEPGKTPAEVVSCLKSNQLLIDFVLKNIGVDLNTITEADVVGESTYKDLPKFLADKKLMTLDEAKVIFGNTIPMTFKVGEVISSGNATMLDNEADVKSRRGNGEKMLFSTNEPYQVVLKDEIVTIFRRDCLNWLQLFLKKPKIKEVSSPTPTVTPTFRPGVSPTAEKYFPTATATATEVAAPSSTPKTPDTATPPVPSSTPEATETSVPSSTPETTETPAPPQPPTAVKTSTPETTPVSTSTVVATVTSFPTETVIPGSTSTPRATETPAPPQPPTAVKTSTPETTPVSTSTVVATVTSFPTETVIPGSTSTPISTNTPRATETAVKP